MSRVKSFTFLVNFPIVTDAGMEALKFDTRSGNEHHSPEALGKSSGI